MGMVSQSIFRDLDINAYLQKPSRADRIQLMQTGARELKQWIDDLFNRGLAALKSENKFEINAIATRMVDSKNASWGRILRLMSDSLDRSDWNERPTLYKLIQLYIQAGGVLKIDRLDPLLQTDLLAAAGMKWRRNALENVKPVSDDWLCLWCKKDTLENLTSLSAFLFGIKTGYYVRVNQYVFGREPFQAEFSFADTWSGDIIYFPSPTPLAAFPGTSLQKKRDHYHQPEIPVENLRRDILKQIETNPFRYQWPMAIPAIELLESQTPVLDQETEQETEELKQFLDFASIDRNLTLFGTWSLAGFTPLSLISDGLVSPMPGVE